MLGVESLSGAVGVAAVLDVDDVDDPRAVVDPVTDPIFSTAGPV